MIKSFKDKGLAELFRTGRTGRIAPDMQKRCRDRLNLIDRATKITDLQMPGYALHRHERGRYAGKWVISVNGPWRIAFRFEGADAWEVELVQYH